MTTTLSEAITLIIIYVVLSGIIFLVSMILGYSIPNAIAHGTIGTMLILSLLYMLILHRKEE